MAVLLLLWFCRWDRPNLKSLANCVWLFDRWPNLSRPGRFIYRELLRRADAVTTLSPANMQVAKSVLPGVRCEYIRWGTTIEDLKKRSRKPTHSPLPIAWLGSDIHRDWKTVITAFGNRERYRVVIGSQRIKPKLLKDINNVTVRSVATADDVNTLYE
jgi:hypothetical protein